MDGRDGDVLAILVAVHGGLMVGEDEGNSGSASG